jgi:hypothetical protein
MRWLIQGTDAVTGQSVELSLEDEEATRAVKTAIAKQIVVDRIGPANRRGLWRFIAPTLIVILAGAATALVAQNLVLRHNLEKVTDEEWQLAQSVAQAEQAVKDLRDHGNLATQEAVKMTRVADDLARARISATEQQLVAARQKAIAMEETAAKVPGLERQLLALHEQLGDAQKQLDQSEKLAGQLRTQTTLQERRLGELEKMKPSDEAAARIAQLDAANKTLAGEIEKLKGELLTAVAVASPSPVALVELPPAPAANTPWALGMTFDAARDFAVLHSDRESMSTTPAGTLFATAGMNAANAVRIQFLHDKSRERVYSGTLTVALVADAPKDKLEQNRKTVLDFLGVFAPGLKEKADVLAATAQLAASDETRRIVFVGPDAKITMWNNKGAYTFRAESVRDGE